MRKILDNKIMAVVVMTGIILLFSSHAVFSSQGLRQYCSDMFIDNGVCPKELCNMSCVNIGVGRACAFRCMAKECFEIDLASCPEEYCQKMQGCGGKQVCHDKVLETVPECGYATYSGQDVECCKGMVKRCGIEFFDGTCDMEGKHSVNSIPICIPCGNGVCNQFENKCNCPEDCKRPR